MREWDLRLAGLHVYRHDWLQGGPRPATGTMPGAFGALSGLEGSARFRGGLAQVGLNATEERYRSARLYLITIRAYSSYRQPMRPHDVAWVFRFAYREQTMGQDLAEQFIRYQPMVRHLARKLAATSSIQREELIDEGDHALALLFCKFDRPGVRHRNPTNVADHTWVYRVVRWAMLDYIRSTEKRWKRLELLIAKAEQARVDKPSWLQRLTADLSEDAYTLINLIIFAPTELIDALRVTKRPASVIRARRAIEDYLQHRLGWPPARVGDVWSEVRECIC